MLLLRYQCLFLFEGLDGHLRSNFDRYVRLKAHPDALSYHTLPQQSREFRQAALSLSGGRSHSMTFKKIVKPGSTSIHFSSGTFWVIW